MVQAYAANLSARGVHITVPAAMAKRQRTDLRGFGGIADAKISEFLCRLREDPSILKESAPNRFAMKRIDQRTFEKEVQGRMEVPLTNGGLFLWSGASPSKLLKYYCEHSPAFCGMFDKVAQGLPADHVYRFVVYYDEITPGAQLRLDNSRKFWAFYGACVELGHALQHSDAWLAMGILRTKKVAAIDGGFAAAFAAFLAMVASESEITIDLPVTGPRRIRLTISNNLADEAALKRSLDFKGSAGAVPCAKCRNVLYTRANIPESGYCVTLACPDPGRFDPRSDQDIWDAADHLATTARESTKKLLAEEEKVAGLNHNTRSIVHTGRGLLRPIHSLTFDSMHIWFSNGCANEELYLMMEQLGTIKVTWDSVRSWLESAFSFPSHQRAKLRALPLCFNDARRKATRSSQEFKASASEMLSLVPIVQHFLEEVIGPTAAASRIAPALRCFRCLAEVVVVLQQAKRIGDPRRLAHSLAQKITVHFEAYLAAYGGERVRWKRHAAFHVPDQLARDGRLLDAFALERKHKLAKECADPVLNCASFEETVLVKMVQSQLHKLKSSPDLFRDTLLGNRAEIAGVCMADGLHWQGATIHRGDVLLLENPEAAVVMEYSACQGVRFYLLVAPLSFISRSSSSSTWRKKAFSGVRFARRTTSSRNQPSRPANRPFISPTRPPTHPTAHPPTHPSNPTLCTWPTLPPTHPSTQSPQHSHPPTPWAQCI